MKAVTRKVALPDWAKYVIALMDQPTLYRELNMDLSKKPKIEKINNRMIIGWKCTIDGKHWAQSARKKCRYCLPIYSDATLPNP